MRIIIVATLVGCLGGLGTFFLTQWAGAGISAQGYANVAQRAVNRVGGPFGYHAHCVGKYDIPGPNFTIKCRVLESP